MLLRRIYSWATHVQKRRVSPSSSSFTCPLMQMKEDDGAGGRPDRVDAFPVFWQTIYFSPHRTQTRGLGDLFTGLFFGSREGVGLCSRDLLLLLLR